MITKDDLETKKTPDDLYAFVESTFESILTNAEEKKVARLRKPPYKELIEEVYPLSIFCKQKYQDKPVLVQPVVGNQWYDAKIETIKGEPVENIELSWPIDGQKENYEAVQLNEKGHTKLEMWDVNDNSQRQQIIERIIVKANDKALKDYSTTEGSSLIFVLDIAPYFGMQKIENPDEIEYLKQKLKEISFKVTNVYLLLLPIKELIEIQ